MDIKSPVPIASNVEVAMEGLKKVRENIPLHLCMPPDGVWISSDLFQLCSWS